MMAAPLTVDVFSMARHNRYDELKKIVCGGNFPIDSRDANGNTLLLVACQNGLKRIVKLALRSGADINAQNNAGNTALHFCFLYGFGQSVGTFLIEQGADEGIPNQKKLLPHQSGLSGYGPLPPLKNNCKNNSSASASHIKGVVDEEYVDVMEEGDDAYDNYSTVSYSYNDAHQMDSSHSNNEYSVDNNEYEDEYEESQYPTPTQTYKVATCFRSPPPSNKSKVMPAIRGSGFQSPSPIVKRSCNRRPPPTTPHPDDIAKQSKSNHSANKTTIMESSSTSSKPTSISINPSSSTSTSSVSSAPLSTLTAKPTDLVISTKPSTPATLSSTTSSQPTPTSTCTDIGPPLALMEAMASLDYVALARAVKTANDREVHAAMLNACARGNLKAVNILLDKSPEDGIVQGAFICARNGHLEILILLLETTEDSQTLDNSLVQASSKGHISIVEHMVSLRKASSESLRRAIMSAVSKNHYKIVEMLIPVVIWDDRKDALVICCKQNYQSCATLLIKDLPGRFMEQPLAVCASKGHFKLIQYILSSSSVLNDLDPTCIAHAQSIAYKAEHWKIVELLSQYNTVEDEEKEGVYLPHSTEGNYTENHMLHLPQLRL